MAFEPVSPSASLLDQVVSDLVAAIDRGSIGEGGRLESEPALAKRYGASRAVIREALAQLRSRGYVTTVNGAGSFARRPDAKHLASALLQQSRITTGRALTVDDLYEARIAIETAATGAAATRASDEALDQLSGLLDRMRETLDRPEEYVAADIAFHIGIAAASGNPLFPTLLDPLASLIVGGMLSSARLPRATEEGVREHAAVLERLMMRDAEGAREAMRSHLVDSCRYFARAQGAAELTFADGAQGARTDVEPIVG